MLGLQDIRVFKGLDPVADFFSGTVRSDVVNISHAHKAFFFVFKGVGTTGTSTIQVMACDDNSPLNETAIPFKYRRVNNTDTPGAVTEAAAAGFATTAGSSDLYAIEVDPKAFANLNYKYVCLKATEVVDNPVLGGILGMLVPRFADSAENITS